MKTALELAANALVLAFGLTSIYALIWALENYK